MVEENVRVADCPARGPPDVSDSIGREENSEVNLTGFLELPSIPDRKGRDFWAANAPAAHEDTVASKSQITAEWGE